MDNALPIRRFADQIVRAVKDNTVVVVIGETGSGKTTQISQILLDAGFADHGQIAVTQPRRVAAVTVAKRVAEERGVQLGQEVGYAVRFEDCTCPGTRIKYLTDGTLLRECLDDPQLSQYSVIVLDEAHERNLNTDILFGLLKQLAPKRAAPLKLVITSATLDGEKFSAFFGSCPVFNVPGRCFPVDIIHSLEDHQQSYLAATVDTVMQIHMTQPQGDILAFLTGQAEIDKAVKQLHEAVAGLAEGEAGPLLVLPLYASLPPDMQVRVFRPAPEGVRRCIVATNVAETSITVDGVVYVVDSGVVKQKHYQPATGMDSLDVVPISRVGATQRAGRAGRTRAGKCFRLYTKQFYDRIMPDVSAPEIQRTSLAGAVLYLKSLRLQLDVLDFQFLDPPSRDALEDALRTLHLLDAVDADGAVTPLGRAMAALPLDPALARCLLAAQQLQCLPDLITIAAMLSTEHVFAAGQGPADKQGGPREGRQAGRAHCSEQLKALMAAGEGDHLLLLRLWDAWRAAGCSREAAQELGLDLRGCNFAREVRRQLEGVMASAGLPDKLPGPGPDSDPGSCRGADSGQEGGQQAGLPGHRGKRQRQEQQEPGEAWGGPGPGRGGVERAKGQQAGVMRSEAQRLAAVKQALTTGFAHKLARRLPRHNGYRTLGSGALVGGGQLAQPHPACAPLREDEDGLLPEWLVFHELVATSRPFLRNVCPTSYEYVAPLLTKIAQMDVKRLSGGSKAAAAPSSAAYDAEPRSAVSAVPPGTGSGPGRRNDSATVSAARQRFLDRKSSLPAATASKAAAKKS
ncbi:DEAH-box nuclear pre-mRNA splicing factor [Haematococcus lacustris]